MMKRQIVADLLKIDSDELDWLGEGSYATVFAYKGKAYKLTEDFHDFKVCTKLKNSKNKYERLVKIYDTKVVNVYKYNECRTYYLIVAEIAQCANNSLDTFAQTVSNLCSLIRERLNDYLIFTKFEEGNSVEEILENVERFSDKNKDWFLEECIRTIGDMHQLGMDAWDFHNENFAIKNGKLLAIDLGHNTASNIRVSQRRKAILKY